jgi:hypothetical protein
MSKNLKNVPTNLLKKEYNKLSKRMRRTGVWKSDINYQLAIEKELAKRKSHKMKKVS